MNKVTFLNEFTLQDFAFLQNYTQRVVLVDENTKRYCYPLIADLLGRHALILIKSGEEEKTLTTCTYIWSEMTALNLDRKAVLINLGGGVIGDMGGFCAATYKRGIDFIQIPTTLLAQVDASVGGKLGIDFQGLKNHLGVFRIPNLVIINPVFLQTLPYPELRSGFAEIIKHALIADKAQWQQLQQTALEHLVWQQIIPHSVNIKTSVVEADPTEKGLRKILNFGHTVGHAIESYYLPTAKKLLHGEAIAIGMICEAYLSMRKNNISAQELSDICTYILSVYDKKYIQTTDYEGFKSYILQDKKNEGATIQCALLGEIGKATFNDIVSWEEIADSIDFYRDL
jgi:3-dehydroquinate synthase